MPDPRTVGVTFLVVFFILISFSSCDVPFEHESLVEPRAVHVHIAEASTQEACGFVGSSDVYGVGIRIGYYAQTISIWIANFFVLREAKTLRAVNTLFMFAMFIGLIFISVDPTQTYVAEAYIMIVIIYGVWYVGTTDVSRFSRKHWKFDFERTFIRNGCFAGMGIYNVWYWWTGIDHMQRTPCGTYGFFFSRVALDGWFRKANVVLSIIGICFHMLLECGYLFRTIRHFICRKINTAQYQERLARSLLKEVDDAKVPSRDDNGQVTVAEVPTFVEPEFMHPEYRATTADGISGKRSMHSTISIASRSATFALPDRRSSSKGPRIRSLAIDTIRSETEDTLDLPTFQELYVADKYISNVLSACPTSLTEKNRFQISLLGGTLRLYIPSIRPLPGNDAVSWRTCFKVIFGAIRRRCLNSPAIAVLFSHIYALQLQPFYQYPRLLYRALTDTSHTRQKWHTLAVIADIRITRLPDKTRKWYWIPSAIQTGFITVGLVLAIELTVWWNHISGVNQIGTVGQLIPLTLGIGGLVKVLWSWFQLCFRSDGKELEDDGLVAADVRLAEVYYKRKEAYERSMGIAAPALLNGLSNV